MKSISLKRTALLFFSSIVYLSFALQSPGCGSDSVTTPVNTAPDTNVVVFDSLGISITSTNLGINLLIGKITASSDSKKDALVASSVPGSYFFESGSLAGGEKTMFNLVDSNYTQAQFNALSSVSAWGSSGSAIDPAKFTQGGTQTFYLLTQGMTKTPVFGFYLQGRFDNHETSSRVFGMIRVRSFTGSGLAASVLSISVRINKAGLNKFTN
jgi:hypothetical protein